MRVEARHPAGEWLPLSPAEPLPAPQTHYQWRWTPLNVASIDHPLTFSFSAGTLARSDELAQYGIIHDPHASSRLMIVEESEDTLALAEKVIAALTASAAGLIVVTRRAWRVEENEALSASHHAMGLASRRGQRTAGTVACRHRSRRKHPVGNAASRVERSLTITALARRTG